MRRHWFLMAALLPAVGFAFWWIAEAQPPVGPGKGPAVIEAAKYPSLQAALDAIPETGGVVHLPPGTFELSQPLVLARSDTRLTGAGAATHLVNKNQNGQPALIVRPSDLAKNKKARLWRVQLDNFRTSGNPKSGDGVLAEGINEIFIHGLSVDHHGGHGLNLVDCYEDPRIADSILTYNGQAGLNILRGHDIVVNANHFEENQDALRCADSFNLCMNGNNLDDHLRHGVVIENTYGSVLSGNMIEECKGTAIILDRDCYGITLSANVIAHNFGGGVELRDAWGCAVSANTFVLSDKFGLRIGPGSGRITVTGNDFSDSYIGGKTRRIQQAAFGVVLEGATDIALTGNVLSGLQGPGIQADAACRRLLITGNLGTDLQQAQAGKGPAFQLGQPAGSLAENNLTEQAK